MAAASPPSPWAVPLAALGDEDSAFRRLWRGFMTARAGVAVVLTVLVASLHILAGAAGVNNWIVALCATYLVATLAVRTLAHPPSAATAFDPQWVSTIGVDLVAFSTLQFLQVAGLNYSPLFALPVLTAAVLGSSLLTLGTAAGVTILLLMDAWVLAFDQSTDHAQRFLQAGLTGTGFFAMAMLAHGLATRLAREEQSARRSLLAARTQAQVNELVIEALSQGVLVVDAQAQVHAANPAASSLLGGRAQAALPAPLAAVAQRTFAQQAAQAGDVALPQPGGEKRLLHVRTRLTPPQQLQAEPLCVMFLQDLREMEARLRTEKLAAMGRMSTAVAHEIRNPLAAIAQANELLAEELAEPAQKQLSELVRHNAQRLSRIVEDILDIARVQQGAVRQVLHLDETACVICDEWAEHARAGDRLRMTLEAGSERVPFESEHLRRVLVNLLDNALRYAGHEPDSIRVATRIEDGRAQLTVFSDGPPLEHGVQQHLFEPFFSSESRSSGLGLYICRELCERHGASIGYRRVSATSGGRDGNEFFVTFGAPAGVAGQRPFDTIAA